MSKLFDKKPLDLLLSEMASDNRLKRALGKLDLTSLGVGAIIGTGIFVLTGIGAHDKAGPALIMSFVVSGAACVFAALCYAEFASMVPIAGSAYTYAYATLGELFAWIIGWDLILEYAVSTATVAHGWSHYFQELLLPVGIILPENLMRAPFDYSPATGGFVATGSIMDFPALAISMIVTILIVRGVKESARFNDVMVALKLTVVLFVIVLGAFYINPANWTPFAPYGWTGISFFGNTLIGDTGLGGEPLGMIAGAAMVFFAYIGFDAVSTQAEEARNPSKDVPFGIIASLLVCTVLYIAVTAILTGMVPYNLIDVDAPIAAAFASIGLPWAQFLISFGAIAGITSVLIVMTLSQPRIFLAMARDGLLPKNFFGAIHPKYRTPHKSTILTGVFVGVLAAFLPLRVLAELVNIGTLLAFVIVCSAVLVMRRTHPNAERPFKAPFFPFVPIAGIGFCALLMFSLPSENWLRLIVWLAIGFVIYFAYGRKHSELAKYRAREGNTE